MKSGDRLLYYFRGLEKGEVPTVAQQDEACIGDGLSEMLGGGNGDQVMVAM